MKGLILLFLSIVFGMIGWKYIDTPSKDMVKSFVKGNFVVIIIAAVAVAIAIFLSVNTTMRLV